MIMYEGGHHVTTASGSGMGMRRWVFPTFGSGQRTSRHCNSGRLNQGVAGHHGIHEAQRKFLRNIQTNNQQEEKFGGRA